jgi:hypothetical protein
MTRLIWLWGLVTGVGTVLFPFSQVAAQADVRSPSASLAPSIDNDIEFLLTEGDPVCPRKFRWIASVKGSDFFIKTRNTEYQRIPIALRGNGSASMDHTIQPGRNLKYRITGTFDGKGRVWLRLEDLAQLDRPCVWEVTSSYRTGIAPGIAGGRLQ